MEDAIVIVPSLSSSKITIDDTEYRAHIILADSSLFRMFDVQIIEGNRNFLTIGSREMAVTQETARRWFGNESPLGKEIDYYDKYTICAVVTDLPKRSNYRFELIGALREYILTAGEEQLWYTSNGENALVKLAPGVDVKAFGEKLYEHEVERSHWGKPSRLTLTPITRLRYTDTDIRRDVRFRHILIFALAGSLLILCTLFNYLTLFVSRFRARQKEMALRIVCGASGRSLLALLSVEFCISLLLAFVLGTALIRSLYEPFRQLADVQTDLPAIYGESFLYIGLVAVVSLSVFWLLLMLFRRRTLHASIRSRRKAFFRKSSIIVQLLISVGFAFCTTVILKQMYYLHHTDLGFTFKNKGSLSLWNVDKETLAAQLRQIPGITDAFPAVTPLVPMVVRMNKPISSWDGKAEEEKSPDVEHTYVSEQYVSHYEFRLVEGEMPTDSDADDQVLINESAAKAFGWGTKAAVGKRFNDQYTVKGVIKDIHNFPPTVPPAPTFYLRPQNSADNTQFMVSMNAVLFRYSPGTWKACKARIEQLIREEYPDQVTRVSLYREEEEYDKYLKSENALLQILSFVSLVCLLICVFGFVSLVSQTCEERRREMAIRKINGAMVCDLLSAFFREYFVLLLVGSALAFAAGYVIMRRWLEQYLLQTAIPAWVYASILGAMTLVIVLCVGWLVYRASVENPAEVVKSE